MKLTVQLANTITSEPRRRLTRYSPNWYHIMVVELPISLLCGTAFGKRPMSWDRARLPEHSRKGRVSDAWLCDRSWAVFRGSDASQGGRQ